MMKFIRVPAPTIVSLHCDLCEKEITESFYFIRILDAELLCYACRKNDPDGIPAQFRDKGSKSARSPGRIE